jgi:hypothetical protein
VQNIDENRKSCVAVEDGRLRRRCWRSNCHGEPRKSPPRRNFAAEPQLLISDIKV